MTSKKCTLVFTEFADEDLSKLSIPLKEECWEVLQKLEKNIHLGKPLDNNGIRDLSGCYKLYFHEAEYRIIYVKKNEQYEIQRIGKVAEIVGIGKRKDYEIYDQVARRLNKFLNN